MRSLCAKAAENGEAILLLDFANAFNTVDRNLMISLAAKLCPELANVTWWLYKLEPHLMTSRGDVILSSSGIQQGCRLSNPLFALMMEFFAKKLQDVQGLRKPLFFWDDTALVGKPKALAQAVSIINKYADMTGLQLKWKKFQVHALPLTLHQCKIQRRPFETS